MKVLICLAVIAAVIAVTEAKCSNKLKLKKSGLDEYITAGSSDGKYCKAKVEFATCSDRKKFEEDSKECYKDLKDVKVPTEFFNEFREKEIKQHMKCVKGYLQEHAWEFSQFTACFDQTFDLLFPKTTMITSTQSTTATTTPLPTTTMSTTISTTPTTTPRGSRYVVTEAGIDAPNEYCKAPLFFADKDELKIFKIKEKICLTSFEIPKKANNFFNLKTEKKDITSYLKCLKKAAKDANSIASLDSCELVTLQLLGYKKTPVPPLPVD